MTPYLLSPPCPGACYRGPGGGGHLPSYAGHDSPLVHTPGEEQVGGREDWEQNDKINDKNPRFTAFSYAGSAFGTVISMPLCSYLCEAVGWDSVFYVFGALGIIWFVVWALLVHDGPEIHPRISDEEKEYLQAALTECEAEKPARIPWMRRGLSQISS